LITLNETFRNYSTCFLILNVYNFYYLVILRTEEDTQTYDRYALPVHTARIYGPYVRAVCTGVKNAPVYTGRKYGPYIPVLGTHYPYRIAVLYGPYIRAVYTGVKNTPVCTGRTYGPYIRPVFTGSAIRPLLTGLSCVPMNCGRSGSELSNDVTSHS